MAEEVGKKFGIFRGRRRLKVELADSPERVYVYEDEQLRLEIPVPPIDVFSAFVRELDKLGAEDADIERYVTTLARAFWLLHHRPRRGLFGKRYELPEVDEEAALKLLKEKVRRADVAFMSLAPALFGFIKHVTGGGNAGEEPRDDEARIKP
jgi:MoxR-like ATPase